MYSQNGEEPVILAHFQGRRGTFLDIGAYTGVELSNTRALAELGWKGVMVEPSPDVFKRLQSNYEGFSNVYLYNLAIASFNGSIEFFDNPNAIATTIEGETKRWAGEQFNKIVVPCQRIDTFLEGLLYKTFDFVSIDIEGGDLDLIKQIDFNKLKTNMVCVEWNSRDQELYNNVMLPQGYHLAYVSGENLVYAK